MVPVPWHFGRSPNQQARQRSSFDDVSLARLLFRPSVEGDAYIAHGPEATPVRELLFCVMKADRLAASCWHVDAVRSSAWREVRMRRLGRGWGRGEAAVG
jgi:hypothetical protein